jgi:hypothetical protein
MRASTLCFGNVPKTRLDTILSKASRRFLLAQPLQLGLAILGIALGALKVPPAYRVRKTAGFKR